MNIEINKEDLNDFYRAFLETYENTTDAPLDYLLTALLPAIGGLISLKRWIQWGNKKIYPNIWIMLVGASTNMRKSTSLNIGLNFNYTLNEEDNSRNFILPNDGSFIAFLNVLKDEKQGVLKHSEVESLLKNMSKGYNNNMKSLFTDFFDVPSQHKVSFKKDELLVVRPIFSLSTATTLNWLKKNITKNDSESGFLARFIYCYKTSKEKSIPIPKAPPKENIEKLKEIITKLSNLPEKEIQIDDSFKKVFEEYYCEIDKLINSECLNDSKKAFIGRLQTDYFLKLTILECVLTGKDTASSVEALRVKELITYFIYQAFMIVDCIMKTDTRKNEEKILTFIGKKQKVSLTDIHKLFSNNLYSGKLKSIISSLISVGLVNETKVKNCTYYELTNNETNQEDD